MAKKKKMSPEEEALHIESEKIIEDAAILERSILWWISKIEEAEKDLQFQIKILDNKSLPESKKDLAFDRALEIEKEMRGLFLKGEYELKNADLLDKRIENFEERIKLLKQKKSKRRKRKSE